MKLIRTHILSFVVFATACFSIPAWAAPAPAISSRENWWTGESATGDWGGTRTQLANRGVDLGLTYYSEVWGNTTGGIKTGAVYTGLGQLETSVDFDKLLGWKGGSFYSRWLWLSGRDASQDLAGNMLTISNIAGYNTIRNLELWLQQNCWDDKFSLRIGQLAADTEFIVSDYGSLFLNATFGWPPFIYTSIPNGGPGYPVGTPGVRLAVSPVANFTLLGGFFQGDVFAQNVNTNGFDWRLDGSQGFLYMAEAQYRHNFWLPGSLKAGTWIHSGDFLDAAGELDATGNPILHSPDYGLYLIVDQMVYREPQTSSSQSSYSKNGKTTDVATENPNDQGLGIFARFAYEPSDRNLLGFYFDAGLNYKGLIPTRDEDSIGVAVGYAQLTNGAKDSLSATGSLDPGFELVVEATYQAPLTDWLLIQPDLQYIVHPGGTKDLGNAFVIGVRAVITF